MSDIAYKDNLMGSSWLGEVVDVDDPERMGRCRVRVYGKFDQLEVGDIPWASCGQSVTAGSDTGGGFLSVPKEGSVVAVTFPNGDLYFPEYRFNQQLSKEARDEVRSSYANAHVLLYDTVTDGAVKIFFTEKKGLTFDYAGTVLTIKPNNTIEVVNPHGDKIEMTNGGKVTVKCDDAKIEAMKSIHLDCSLPASIKLGKSVSSSAILGEAFMALFNAHVHLGNIGYPTLPPVTPMTPALLSQVVKVQ